MEDTFFTGRALSKNLQDVIFFRSEKNVQDTGVFLQDVRCLFSNILGVLIQETLGARFGLNKEFKCRR